MRYFLEMRRRALCVFIFFGVFFALFFFIANHLFNLIVCPLLTILPNGNSLIATTITGPVFAELNLATNFALLFTAPVIIYHCYLFIYPALYKKEIYNIGISIVMSFILFIVGICSCYFLILPLIFKFLISAVPDKVTIMPDINYTIDFIFRMMLIFGICFQLPLLMLGLVKSGIIEISKLKYYRPHFIVTAFIVGMIFTPPDVFSQIMLALPLIILYEIGLILVSKINLL